MVLRGRDVDFFGVRPFPYLKTVGHLGVQLNMSLVQQEITALVANFDAEDRDFFRELVDLRLRNSSSQSGALTTCGDLDLDNVMRFMRKSSAHRARTCTTIMKNIHHDMVRGFQRGGNNQKSQIVFHNMDGFINACILLRGPRAQLMQEFAAKCTAFVVNVGARYKLELQETKQNLIEAETRIEHLDTCKVHRVFTYIKGMQIWSGKVRYKYWGRVANYLVSQGLAYVDPNDTAPYLCLDRVPQANAAIRQKMSQLIQADVPVNQPQIDSMFPTL